MNANDFYDAFQYLNEHEIFKDDNNISRFAECLYVDVVKVNPETMEISDNDDENTKVQVWLECGPFLPEDDEYTEGAEHDIDLDCGADTYEEAIIELAKLVWAKYDNDEFGEFDEIEEFND